MPLVTIVPLHVSNPTLAFINSKNKRMDGFKMEQLIVVWVGSVIP